MTLSRRLGVALRDTRRRAGLTQFELALRSGVSQARISEIERGDGWATTLLTWACLAAAVGEQLVAFLELAPWADLPRDIEHLRRQSAVIELARAGGWTALPELAIDPAAVRSRSIDVALVRRRTHEAVVVEIWDWLDDVGGALRSLDGKAGALRRRLAPGIPSDAGPSDDRPPGDWRVGGLFVVRDTRRNRRLVDELRPLFTARFGGSAAVWLRAVSDGETATPSADGFLWSRSDGSLRASRLGRS